MKYKVPFLIPALFSVMVLFAEKTPVIKIYAYSQVISQGKNPGQGIINENGTEEKEKVKPGIHYLIYLEQARTDIVIPEHIWIHGKGYSIESILITDTPVELENQAVYNGSKKNMLVPETSNKVLQLVQTGIYKEPGKRQLTLKKLISASDLVVSYFWKGKMYYKGIKKIKMLEPIAAV